ncbi:MAG: cobaltochelatase subunit CobN, partial [Desulfatitalea sp.]
MRRFIYLCLFAFSAFLFFLPEAQAHQVAILEVDINSYQVHRAVSQLDLPPSIATRFFTWQDLEHNPEARRFIADSAVVLVNVMMPELADYMVDEKLMAGKAVYALNSAGDPEALAKKGFLFDREILAYYHNLTVANLIHMVRLTVHHHIDPAVAYGALEPVPEACIHHPDAPGPFLEPEAYRQWYARRSGYNAAKPLVGLLFYSNTLKEGQVEAADALIRALEAAGLNVRACFGPVPVVFDFLKPTAGRPPVDLVLAFSLKFSSGINDEVRAALKALDVPIFNAITPYGETMDEWRRSEVGLGPMETVWAVATPEFSGAIEPTVLTGKKEITDAATGRRLYVYETVPECLDFLILRLKKLAALQRMPNGQKRVAVLYYNHSQGKQNIGAAYLNVFRSLQTILNRMRQEGYGVQQADKLTEEGLKALIMRTGRNIGSWAPGELDAMLAAGELEIISLAEYQQWFAKLPEPFRAAVVAQWGPPESSKIMVKDGNLILPMVRLGNVVLLPEPARGWTDDPAKLYHDTTLYPHHQYIAAYLWLSEKFKADAMVHLGTHATYEWLPGKQVGLAPWDPPEIMTGAIPNIYPYIVDDVGEGIAVKRRGRGVIVDHLTPPMKEADLYNEYAELKALLGKYELARSMAAETAEAYLRQLEVMVVKLGLLKDLELARFDAAAVETLDLYLHEMDTNSLPYGLHTFGKPYDPQAAKETVALIRRQNPQADGKRVRRDLTGSADREMENLLRGLAGRYVPAGEGNDPLRNLAAIPTGKNFYGFSPAKVPSKAAWEIGKRAA